MIIIELELGAAARSSSCARQLAADSSRLIGGQLGPSSFVTASSHLAARRDSTQNSAQFALLPSLRFTFRPDFPRFSLGLETKPELIGGTETHLELRLRFCRWFGLSFVVLGRFLSSCAKVGPHLWLGFVSRTAISLGFWRWWARSREI